MAHRQTRFTELVEMVSAVAVVFSLVFVGLEVRGTSRQTALNTEALQVAAYQDLIGQIGGFNQLLLDPEVAMVYERLQEPDGDWSDFSVVDRRRARSVLFFLFRHADMAYYQYERGMLPAARLKSALAPLLDDTPPLYLSFWQDVKPNFVPEFSIYLDEAFSEASR